MIQPQNLDMNLSDNMIKKLTKRMEECNISEPVEGEPVEFKDIYRMMVYSFLSLDDLKN